MSIYSCLFIKRHDALCNLKSSSSKASAPTPSAFWKKSTGSKFKHEHKVITFGNGIVPEDIMGVQKVDQNGNPIGGFIKNPGFKKV